MPNRTIHLSNAYTIFNHFSFQIDEIVDVLRLEFDISHRFYVNIFVVVRLVIQTCMTLFYFSVGCCCVLTNCPTKTDMSRTENRSHTRKKKKKKRKSSQMKCIVCVYKRVKDLLSQAMLFFDCFLVDDGLPYRHITFLFSHTHSVALPRRQQQQH